MGALISHRSTVLSHRGSLVLPRSPNMVSLGTGILVLGEYFPWSGNTGYQTGPNWSGILTPASSNTISSPGTYQNLVFTDTGSGVAITSDNVVLQNCLIIGSASNTTFYLNVDTGGTATNVKVLHNTIIGASGNTNTGVCLIRVGGTNSYEQNVEIAYNDLSVGEGIEVDGGPAYVHDNYTHALTNASGGNTHYEGLYYGGSADTASWFSLDVEHNTFDMTQMDQTASIHLQNDFGTVQNVTVNNNLVGGNPPKSPGTLYDINFRGDGNSGKPFSATGTNNYCYPTNQTSGTTGYFNTSNGGLGGNFNVTLSGNIDAIAGTPVTG
jgi:hypothetical protein